MICCLGWLTATARRTAGNFADEPVAFAVGVATRGDEADAGLLTATGSFVSE
jgi:hypothetical protein